MGTHGLWLLLLIDLGYENQFRQKVSKRSIDDSGECQQLPHRRNSFLWVMKRAPPVYLFGTIHVPYTKVWDYIPFNSKQAFYETDNIYFELDLTDPVTRKTLAECQTLPKGIKLRDVVPLVIYKRIKRHLSYVRKMLPVWMTVNQKRMGLTSSIMYKALTKNWHKKRPIWIMVMLNALTEYDTKDRGISVLDMYLIREAVSRIKHTGSIERVEEQCEPLNALNNSQVVIALNQTLNLHEKIRRGEASLTYSTKDLIYHYNCGDLSKILSAPDISNLENFKNSSLSSFEMEQTRKFDQYLREELLYKRNKRMANRVVQHILEEPNESFFFAFGAGHFLGNGSIIDLLREKGYNISHLNYNDSLPRNGLERKVKHSRRRNRNGSIKKNRNRNRRRHLKKQLNIDNLWKRDPSWKLRSTHRPSSAPTTRKEKSPLSTSSSAFDLRQISRSWTNTIIIFLMFNLFFIL